MLAAYARQYRLRMMTQPPPSAPRSCLVARANLLTPALLLDEVIMQRNVTRMQQHLAAHDVVARPHVKTAKCLPVIERMLDASDTGDATKLAPRLTVSTLREAAEMLAAGYTDVLYAVGMVPQKLPELARLAAAADARVSVVLDSVAMAQALVGARLALDAFIELDVDDHRAGVTPDSAELLAIGRTLAAGSHPGGLPLLRGVMTHAGGAYDCRTEPELIAMAERERSGAVRAAQRLRAAGIDCAEVSIGSTPTVSVATSFVGVTEVRVGVYVFNDLMMVGLGVCQQEDIALSVLTTVIGHQPRRNTLLVDAGWMALSNDRSTTGQHLDQGLGLVVCDQSTVGETPADADLVVVSANQEHGLVSRRDGGEFDFGRFPIGSELRILPVHACSTAAAFAGYHRLAATENTRNVDVVGFWPRFGGWHA